MGVLPARFQLRRQLLALPAKGLVDISQAVLQSTVGVKAAVAATARCKYPGNVAGLLHPHFGAARSRLLCMYILLRWPACNSL